MPDATTLSVGLLAIQLAAFAWRIAREVKMESEGEPTWLPLSDLLNVVGFLTVTVVCIVAPLGGAQFGRGRVTVLGVGFMLMAFYPIAQAAHYDLLFGRRREQPYPWMTGQELVISLASVVVAALTGCVLWHNAP
jgi:hypothetical protein